MSDPQHRYDSRHTTVRIPRPLYDEYAALARRYGIPVKQLTERVIRSIVGHVSPMDAIARILDQTNQPQPGNDEEWEEREPYAI